MSGMPELKSALIKAGMPEPRIEGVVRYQTSAGLHRKLSRGRRAKNADDALTALNYCWVILGLSSVNPIDAPTAAMLLGDFVHKQRTLHLNEPSDAGEPTSIRQVAGELVDQDLALFFALEIKDLARLPADERNARRVLAKNRFIRMDIARLSVIIPRQFEDGSWIEEQFGPVPRNKLGPQEPEIPALSWGFEVKLELEIVFIAADLLAETLAKQNGGAEPSEGDLLAGSATEDGATVTNDDAPDLAGSGASRGDRSCNQSRVLNASGQSHASEDREGGIFAQQRIPVSDWVSPTLRRKTPDLCLPSMA